MSSALQRLGQSLAGEFDNRSQAYAEPAWYVHLKLWHRWIPLFPDDSLTFFIEQVSMASGKPPYRQRILRLQEHPERISGQYYGLQQPQRWQGGAMSPGILKPLSVDDLVELPTCQVNIPVNPSDLGQSSFVARMPDGCLCSFQYGQNITYVSLGFDIGPSLEQPQLITFSMYDKGINPETGQGIWGALMGPFNLIKQTSFQLS